MQHFIKCETREESGTVYRVVSWTMPGEMPGGLSQRVYPGALYGSGEAMADAAERLGVEIGPVAYGVMGYSAAPVICP